MTRAELELTRLKEGLEQTALYAEHLGQPVIAEFARRWAYGGIRTAALAKKQVA